MSDGTHHNGAASHNGDAAPTRELEELLFECLEARARGDEPALEQLLAANQALADELRRLIAVVDQLGPEPSVLRLGEYELLRPIGGGGMGVVHLARQRRLQRLVAIKLIRPEMLGSAKMRERFQREARALARVTHPGICPIYDFGEVDGQPYLVMQYIPGQRLSDCPPPQDRHGVQRLLEMFEQICEAVQVAHDAGLVHRDLKPQNILLSATGRPVVLDFGLARMVALDGDEDSLLTTQGQPVGTPVYMAPERLSGAATGAGVDVYSLGVSLYQMVTGELPFRSPVLQTLWAQIQRGEVPLRALKKRHLPAETAIVVATAMEREPSRRYDSAASLGEDLRRLRLGLPILARRPSMVTRVVRWTQRNRSVAGLIVGMALLLLLISFGYTVLAAEQQHNKSQALAGDALRQRGKSPRLDLRLALAAREAEDNAEARSEVAQALAQCQVRMRWPIGSCEVLDRAALASGGVAMLLSGEVLRMPPDFPGQQALRHPTGATISRFSITPDEQQVALAGDDGKLWLLSTGEVREPRSFDFPSGLVSRLQFSPDGKRLAIGSHTALGAGPMVGTVSLLDLERGSLQVLGEYHASKERPILEPHQLLFRADGKRLVAVVRGYPTHVYDLDAGGDQLVRGGDHAILSVVFSRDGSRLFCGGQGGRVFAVDLASGEQTDLGRHEDQVAMVTLSPDGRTLATASKDRRVQLWSVDVAKPAPPIVLMHPVAVWAVAFRDDGQVLATGGNDGVVRLWSPRGDPLLTLAGGSQSIDYVRFEPERIWVTDTVAGAAVYQLRAHERPLLLSSSAVTRLLPENAAGVFFSGSANGTVTEWSSAGGPRIVRDDANRTAVSSLDVDAAGGQLLSVLENSSVSVDDLHAVAGRDSGQDLTGPQGPPTEAWFVDGGRAVVVRSFARSDQSNGLTRFERDATGKFELVRRRPLPRGLGRGCIDPLTGSILISRRDAGGHLVVAPSLEAEPVPKPGEPCSLVQCSTDGALLASCLLSDVFFSRRGEAKAYAHARTDNTQVMAMQFSPDGKHFGVINRSGAVWLFATGDGQLVWRGQLPGIGWSLAFTADGRHLLTGGSDGVIRSWLLDPEEQRQLALRLLQDWQWEPEELRILAADGVDPTPR